jgi:Holliday junction resolvase
MARWEEQGYNVVRTAGSHGLYDVVAFRADRKPEFIQCKRVETEAEAKRLIDKFRKSVYPSSFFHQVIEVKVKGAKGILSWTV